MKNLQHNNTSRECGSFEGRSSLPFKVVQTVEIEFEGGDDQQFKFELRGNPWAHISQPIRNKLTCHIRQKSHKPFFFKFEK